MKGEAVRLEDSEEVIARLEARFLNVWGRTDQWRTLPVEDLVPQAMPDCSPIKWHLVHIAWFFEMFVLLKYFPKWYECFDPQFLELFNSYYLSIPGRFVRANRGLLVRPLLHDVGQYRDEVFRAMRIVFQKMREMEDGERSEALSVIELGVNHEEQHQELMVTDIKYLYYQNPSMPPLGFAQLPPTSVLPPPRTKLIDFEGKLRQVGKGDPGFMFDNEGPSHPVFLRSFSLANRLVTNREYLSFIIDGGYSEPLLWSSDGWARVNSKEDPWCAPLYWFKKDEIWWYYTLGGVRPVEPHEPVCHVSRYEAQAYAKWSRWEEARLPTEFEWEVAAAERTASKLLVERGTVLEDGYYHPAAVSEQSLLGGVWEWTSSAYTPYPGYKTTAGPLGEYNGKFMDNQYVLRGGSCATSIAHIRPTYRNFFRAGDRWQFSGIRLAMDGD